MQTESTAPGIALRKDLQHCPDVWYLDGSAILLAENTLFRVYSGLLAQYSTVFRDMFQIPQPDLQEQYDGLPLIELYDSAVDLRRFLIAMHNSGAYEPGPSADMDFIASVLKISTKYDVPHLRKQFVTALTPYFPSTLLDFDEAPEMPGESLDHVTAQLFRITNICKECDLPVLLPVAYFWICEVDMEKLLDGVKPEEEDSPITLTPANLRSVLLARDGLQHRTRQRNFSFIFDRSKSIHEGEIGLEATCTSPDRCNQFRESFIRPFFEADYLKPLSKIFGSGVYLGFSLCDYCSEKTLTCTEEERAALWEDLPSIFGLADWETLAQETSSSHLHVRRSVLNIEPRAAFWY